MVTLLANFAPMLAAEAVTSGGHVIPDWAKGNSILEYFFKGGIIMYPLVAVLVVAIAVILERLVWWIVQTARRDPGKLDKVYAALEQGNVPAAINIARGSKDPLVRTVWHGLNHVHASVEGALQVASGVEIQRAGRFMSVMDTTITLAPLLGLLGTVSVRSGNRDLYLDLFQFFQCTSGAASVRTRINVEQRDFDAQLAAEQKQPRHRTRCTAAVTAVRQFQLRKRGSRSSR
jgi:hypothetical protein